jgi:hypothetical protein
MFRRMLFLLLVCACSASGVDASPSREGKSFSTNGSIPIRATGLTVQTLSHGVRLTLTLPKRIFAADEIARATVRVDNLSHRALTVDHRCDLKNPEVDVRAASGFPLYPPPVDFLSAPPRCPFYTTTLRPGASLVTFPYIIVRAKYLQARVLLAPQRVKTTGLGPGPYFVVRTPVTRVRLVPAEKPAVQLCSFSHLCANVEPPLLPVGLQVHGPLLYAFTAQCGSKGVPRYIQSVWLQPAPANHVFKPPRYRVYPGCDRPAIWNFVVGWLGTPSVRIHFVRPSR